MCPIQQDLLTARWELTTHRSTIGTVLDRPVCVCVCVCHGLRLQYSILPNTRLPNRKSALLADVLCGACPSKCTHTRPVATASTPGRSADKQGLILTLKHFPTICTCVYPLMHICVRVCVCVSVCRHTSVCVCVCESAHVLPVCHPGSQSSSETQQHIYTVGILADPEPSDNVSGCLPEKDTPKFACFGSNLFHSCSIV